MEHQKREASFMNPRKQPLIPPKSPFPNIDIPVYEHFDPFQLKQASWLREGEIQHNDTSELYQIEEEFSWLEELLEEPETPKIKAPHRRSSSDSIAYLNGSQIHSNLHSLAQEEYRQRTIISTMPAWASHECNLHKDALHYFADESSSGRLKDDAVWMSRVNMERFSNIFGTTTGKHIHLWPSSEISKENGALRRNTFKKLDQKEPHEDLKIVSEENDIFEPKHTHSGLNSKRVKQ